MGSWGDIPPRPGTPKSLLVISTELVLTTSQREVLSELAAKVEKSIRMRCLVLEGGMKAHVHSDNADLVAAITEQTNAITALAESNRMIVEAMAGTDDDGDDSQHEPLTYIDGSPVRG